MWKQISSKYECSDDGHIRNRKSKHVLKEFDSCKDGYLRTQFDGKTRTVHRVIAEAFIPKEDGKQFVNHLDGNKKNNHANNLEWCTRSENIKHAYINNLIGPKIGEQNGRCKLTSEQAKQIRLIYKRGDPKFGAKALSKYYGVARQTICAVAYGQNWKNLESENTYE